MSRNRFIVSAALTAAVVGFPLTATAQNIGAANSPQQQTPPAPNGQPVGGMSCDAQEGQRIHIHQRLVILDHGKTTAIPASIGIPAGKRCIYWVHTHTPDGIIHIEAPLDRSFTLGDFFMIWGEPLTRSQVATAKVPKGESLKVWVNGKEYKGDPRKIPLVAHADIVIQAGPPFSKPAAFTAWGTL